MDAVESAKKLQPDLILLDISLPKLNGFEAARQIAKVAPQSKILFVSEHRSPDILEAALGTGAFGYVLKSDAGSELLPAVRAVLELRRYVSASVGIRDLAHATDHEADNHKQHKNFVARSVAQHTNSRHEVTFYSDDVEFVDGFARFVERCLKAGNVVIVILTESHHASLLQKLSRDGLDMAAEFKQRTYIPLNVADTLSAFMVNDSPDPALLRNVARVFIAEAPTGANGKRRRVAVCGEGVNSLLAAGNLDATIRLERIWNEIAKDEELDIFCGYFRAVFDNEEYVSALERVCAEHSTVHGR